MQRPSPTHFTTGGQSVGSPWCWALLGLMTRICHIWLLQYESSCGVVLSGERAGLSVIGLGLCQVNTYLHVTVSRFTTFLCTICTWPLLLQEATRFKSSHITVDGQSNSLSWCRAPSGAHDQIYVKVTRLGSRGLIQDMKNEGWGKGANQREEILEKDPDQ